MDSDGYENHKYVLLYPNFDRNLKLDKDENSDEKPKSVVDAIKEQIAKSVEDKTHREEAHTAISSNSGTAYLNQNYPMSFRFKEDVDRFLKQFTKIDELTNNYISS